MARRSDHTKEQLHALIVDAASELVAERPPDNVTARMIADRIGYTPGTLYTQFQNLPAIFLHVNGASIDRLRAACDNATRGVDDPRAALLAIGYAYLEFAYHQPNHFRLMFTQVLPAGVAPPSWLQGAIEALFELVAVRLRALRPDAGAAAITVATRALWSGVHGTAMLATSDHLFTQVARIDRSMIESLIDNYLDGWVTRDA